MHSESICRHRDDGSVCGVRGEVHLPPTHVRSPQIRVEQRKCRRTIRYSRCRLPLTKNRIACHCVYVFYFGSRSIHLVSYSPVSWIREWNRVYPHSQAAKSMGEGKSWQSIHVTIQLCSSGDDETTGDNEYVEKMRWLARQSESRISDEQPPLFLRFVNLLINDAIYLLDEVIQKLNQSELIIKYCLFHSRLHVILSCWSKLIIANLQYESTIFWFWNSYLNCRYSKTMGQ